MGNDFVGYRKIKYRILTLCGLAALRGIKRKIAQKRGDAKFEYYKSRF